MTKLKASLWLLFLILVAAPIAYTGYLNQDYFLQTNSLSLLLEKPVSIDYSTPEITNLGYWVGCIVLTWLIVSIVRLPKFFRTRKTIKLLEEQVASQKLEIAQLLEGQKTAPTEQPSTEDQTQPEDTAISNEAAVAAEKATL